MLSIILTILKIIGISILVILGIILLLLLIVGFVPVHYRGKGTYQDKAIYAEGRATWFFHAVTALAAFELKNETPVHICVKVLGFRIYDNLRSAKGKSTKKNKKEKKTKNKSDDMREIQAASISDTEENYFNSDFDINENAKKNEETTNNSSFKQSTDNFDKQECSNKKKSFFHKIVNFFKNITFTFHKICDTINKVLDNIKYYWNLLQLDTTKTAFASCKKQLLRVFKHIMPKKYRINLHLGFDDPAVMGEILAVWGILYPFHQGNIEIQPEFEQKVIEGDFYFKGHMSIFTFVRAACILLFDKNIKLLIKQLRQKN